MRNSRIVYAVVLCALLGLAPVCPAGQVKLPNDIAWVSASDSYKACVLQTWVGAGMRLRELAKAEKPGTWCVVLDADETIISNIDFEKELVVKGIEHTSEGWDAWCNRAAATALPGAREYCALVRELGGRVVVITNREAPTKTATVKNLEALGFACDAVLFREGPYARDRAKTMRRDDIEKGTAKTLPGGKSLPPLKIVMLGGDQMHDLYDADRYSLEQVKDRFARDLVILPNPIYGDWMRNGLYVEAPGLKAAPGNPGSAASSAAGVLTPQEAKGKVGETVIVEGVVAGVRVRERGPHQLNFSDNPREGLSVVIFDKEKFGDVRARYEGKKIRIRGRVSDYRGASQIKASDPAQIEVLQSEGAGAARGAVHEPDTADVLQ